MKKFIKLLLVIITSIFILTGCDITSTNGETKKLDTPYLEYGTNSIIWDSITNADEYLIYVDDVYLTKTNHAYFDDFELSGKTGMLYIIASGDKSRFENSDISNKINLADLANVKSSYESKFLMINDTHGAFVDNQYPGVERLASLIKQLGDEYIKIANGDILQGSYISNILCGYPMIDALNNMNFNAYVIGNHEFDWGLDKIAEYKDGNLTNGEANFPFLGANIIDKKTNEIVDFLEPYTIIEKKDVRVGIIGLIGSRLTSSILYENVKDYEFIDCVDVAKKYAKELRTTKNCDVVVVAIHDYDYETNYQLAQLENDETIDAIFCGHTHTYENEYQTRKDGVNIPVVENRDKNQTAVSVLLELNVRKDLVKYNVNFYNPANFNLDPDMTKVLKEYQSYIDEGNRSLGIASSYLDKNTLGNISVEAMRDSFKTDFAILNTGGVRAYISDGNVTVSDVYNVFPFNNEVYLVEIKGSDLLGFYYNADYYIYINKNFNASEIISDKTYNVAIIDYVFTSMYYQSYFGNVKYVDTDVIMRDLVIEYIDNLI
ncbi:5'-nucleosidase-related surface-anchored protein [Firmicutes bacterium CAG:313]|nr:5'-nucleosidase-related surface-anchored protein [Firmicutes bacterium CAG:313]